ncbi:MAG: hypothetical protein NWR73_01715 [Flavobacteriales bacterium]|nr:hypothetical protein [Flavobacteriales bacterium]
MKTYLSLFAFALLCTLTSCDKNEEIMLVSSKNALTGSGSFTFTGYAPFADKSIEVYYHIPENADINSPILITLHGDDRSGAYSRNAFIEKANLLNFIVLSPQFSEDDFPGGDAYNLCNIFYDGDNPTPASLNDQSLWTFMVFDPIFDYFKELTGNNATKYDLFGFSAGAQVAHRLLIFNPNAKLNRIVAASAGWYTVPNDVIFPYGLFVSPAETADLTPVFNAQLKIIVGSNDNDPDSPGLRHNEFADAQGLTRLDRAQYFYNAGFNEAQAAGIQFNWTYQSVNGASHDLLPMASFAADLLY